MTSRGAQSPGSRGRPAAKTTAAEDGAAFRYGQVAAHRGRGGAPSGGRMDRGLESQRSSPGLQTELAGGVLLTKKVVIDSDSLASTTMTDYRRLRNATFNKTLRSSKQETLERKMDESLETGELYLDGMRISSFPVRLLVDCTHITKLYLHNNSLIVLPPDIQKLTALEDLSLESNQLVSLPKELGKLLHLKRLHCYDNQISSLPAELGLLVELTRLFLSKNQIGSLPPEIGFLKNLQWLSLEDNRLEYLPPEIGNLKKLGWLSVEGNQIKVLPKEMGRLESLEFLSIVDNQMETLPETVVQLENLKDLRTDVTFKIPKSVVDTRDGRTIIKYLSDTMGRWDLNVDEKAHWVPDDECSKCCHCSKPFTTLKRRHHCRVCGLIFCNKDCDTVAEIPGLRVPGRLCVNCFAAVDPSNPTNVYMQLREKEAQKIASKKYGLEAGEENLPLEARKAKISKQVEELDRDIQQGYKAQDGFNRLLAAFSQDVSQCFATQQELDDSIARTKELERIRADLHKLLQSMTA